MADGGYACNIFLKSYAMSETRISPTCGPFHKMRWEQMKFHDCHVWGCPVYVLDKTLGDGKKIPKWKP
jgi:hypothetical protein